MITNEIKYISVHIQFDILIHIPNINIHCYYIQDIYIIIYILFIYVDII